LRWRDAAPKEYGPHKIIYNRFIRWSRLGVFNRIFAELAAKGGKPDQLMIDATHLKTYRAHQRRPELQASRGVRWPWSAADHAAQRRAEERL
jgi:putative transposase